MLHRSLAVRVQLLVWSLALLATATPCHTQPFRQLRDVSQTRWQPEYSSHPEHGATLNGVVYFGAFTLSDGDELFRSDGTPEGTWMVRDIFPGPGGSNPRSLTAAAGRLYFIADDGFHGPQVWVSDGTAAGTQMLEGCGSFPQDYYERPRFYEVGSDVYFYTIQPPPAETVRFWKTDGSPAGTVLIHESDYQSYGDSVCAVGGRVYFRGSDAEHGSELWSTDGTFDGTSLAVDLLQGPDGSEPRGLIELNGRVLFAGNKDYLATQLWLSDGTPSGTTLVSDLNFVWPSTSTVYRLGSRVIFEAGSQPWATDGTVEGTVQLAQLGGTGLGFAVFNELADRLYFVSSSSASPNPSRVWVSDGTPAGTQLFAPLQGHAASTLMRSGDHLYVPLSDESRMCRTDGSAAGTTFYPPMQGPNPYSVPMTLLGPSDHGVVFGATTAAFSSEPWVAKDDLSVALVSDLYPDAGSSFPTSLTPAGSRVFFTASGEQIGLWVTDGTRAGTTLVTPGPTSAPVAVGERVFFRARDPAAGWEVWVSDGTAPGTHLTRDIATGSASSSANYLTAFRGQCFFTATDGTMPRLWRSDGTTSGTTSIPGTYQIFGLTDLTAAAGRLYFTAWDSQGGGLWASDGTIAWLVSHVQPYAPGSEAPTFVGAGPRVYYRAWQQNTGYELWTSDGSEAGTHLVLDLTPGPAATLIRGMIGLGDRLLVAVSGTDGHDSLWVTDGTSQGTVRIKDLMLPSSSTWSTWRMVVADGRAYFVAATPQTGWELWVSDGTSAGSHIVRDIAPGSAPAFGIGEHLDFAVVGSWLYFCASDGQSGYEIWRTDGTELGTTLVADIAPGPTGSGLSGLCAAGDRLYFGAVSHDGLEPWVMDLCYPNCDGSMDGPVLNVNDFVCFLSRFVADDAYANCDGSTVPPVLNMGDFVCFMDRFAAGCERP